MIQLFTDCWKSKQQNPIKKKKNKLKTFYTSICLSKYILNSISKENSVLKSSIYQTNVVQKWIKSKLQFLPEKLNG